jgi:acetyl-CoA carboxylase biotin carboxyl carrier protein
MKEINELIDRLIEKGVNEFELEREGFRIRIRRDNPVVVVDNTTNKPSSAVVAEPPATPGAVENPATASIEESVKPLPPTGDNLHIISSPMVGTFYRAPSPGAKPYVETGDRVKKGQICCIVEAMKLMN